MLAALHLVASRPAGRRPLVPARTDVSRLGPTRHVVERFVAGEQEPAVVSAAAALLKSGRFVSVDFLGEDTTDAAMATATVEAYLSLLRAYAALPVPETSGSRPLEVSLKLSAMGQALPEIGHDVALANARIICEAAAEIGVWVTIDAEDHTTTDSTLAIVKELRRDFPDLGTVLQAYLKRTEDDCRDLSGPRSRIRLCKGAYQEPATVAYTKRDDVDSSYLRCLRVLMNGQGYPMVASHDPAMISRPATTPPRPAGRRRTSSSRCSTASATRSSAVWPPRAIRSGCTCPTASSGSATSCGGSPSARPTWCSSSAP